MKKVCFHHAKILFRIDQEDGRTELALLFGKIDPTLFANGQEEQDSIPGWFMPKTQKMVLDSVLLSTQHYKVRIKGKVEQSWECSSALPYTSV